MKAKIVLLTVVAFGFCNNSNSQYNIYPEQISCWAISQSQIIQGQQNDVTHFSCINAPENAQSSVQFTGNTKVDMAAGKEIHLTPGFSTHSLQGNGNLHAHIGHSDFDVVIYNPVNSNGNVPKHEKLEIGINLPQQVDDGINSFINNQPHPTPINPFDPENISVEATFTFLGNTVPPSPQPLTIKIYGFYYEEFIRNLSTKGWDKDTTSFPFRIRFAPPVNGIWSCKITIITPVDTYEALPFYFNCVPSNSKGRILSNNIIYNASDSENNRYLRYSETGETFFPIGVTTMWPLCLGSTSPQDAIDLYNQTLGIPFGNDPTKLESYQYMYYDYWLEELAASGGNYTNIGMSPETYGIEWEEMGNYYERMPNAWEVDYLVNKAHSLGIYINFLMDIHAEFQMDSYFTANNLWNHDRNSWDSNPYHSINQQSVPGILEPYDFFTETGTKEYYKKRLRYIISRWGYSTNVPILEVMSEVDLVLVDHDYNGSPTVRQGFKDWFIEIRDYMKQDLNAYNLLGCSYSQNFVIHNNGTTNHSGINQRIYEDSDVILLHKYGKTKGENWNERYKSALAVLKKNSTENKPVIWDEMAPVIYATIDYCSDLTFHNNLWATSFMGTFGSGQNWWWDNAIFLKGHQQNFKALKTFFENESLHVMYENDRYNDALAFKNTTLESYYLRNETKTKVMGWAHNGTYFWFNEKDNNACIATCINNDNGHHVDPADNTTYKTGSGGYDDAQNNADGYFINYSNLKLRISNLKWGTFFSPKYYLIQWYQTTGNGGFIPGLSQIVTTVFGTATFNFPSINTYPGIGNYGDLAYKIHYLPNSQMIDENDLNIDTIKNSDIIKEKMDFSIFPNPNDGSFTVRNNNLINSIEIFDLLGNSVHSITAVNKQQTNVYISDLPAGIYIIRVVSENKIYTEKIIKQ